MWVAIVLFATSASSLRASDTPNPAAPKADTAKTDGSQPQPKPGREPKRIKQGKDGSVVLSARDVVVHGKTVRYEPDKNTIGYWTKPDDWVSWELEVTHPDTFTVEMFEACGRGSGGSHYTVEIADQKLTDQVPDTDSFRNFRTRKIGQVKIDKPGDYTLSVRVDDKPGLAVMDLRTITLKPPKADKPEPSKADTTKPDGVKPEAGKADGAKPEPSKSGTAKSAADNWMTDLDRAKQVAAKEGKDLLINFTGLEWCGNCTKLEEVVTSDGFAPAPNDFVLVRLDYPPSPSGDGTIVDRLPQELPSPHVAWRESYRVGAFPTVFLADAAGRPYAVTGNNGMEPAEYLKHVRELRKIHDKRDIGFAAAAKLNGIERAKALADTLKALEAGFANQTDIYTADPLVQFYRPEIDTVMRLDADNAAGLRRHFNDVLHAVERRADEEVFYSRFRTTLKEKGLDATIRLLDKRIAEAETVEIRKNARRSRMVAYEWSTHNEEALAAAWELATDESYSAGDRRFFRTRVAYNLQHLGRTDDAVAVYDKLIADVQDDPREAFRYLRQKGEIVLWQAHRYEEGLRTWDLALKLVKPDKSDWLDVQFWRMRSLARLGRVDDAWRAYNDTSVSKQFLPMSRAFCLAEMADMFNEQGSRAAALDAAAKAQGILDREAAPADAASVAGVRSVIDKVTGAKPAKAGETTAPANSKP